MTLTRQDFELVLDANRILSSKLDLEEVLNAVMSLAAKVVKAQTTSLLLLDETAKELYFNVAMGHAGSAIKQLRLNVGEGVAGWVAENKTSLIVDDVAHDPRWKSSFDEKSNFITRSILAVPMSYMGKLTGVVEAINKTGDENFNEGDKLVLEAFASQAAVAIENAHLFSSILSEKWKMATIMSEMTDGVLLLDANGDVQLANLAVSRIFDVDAGFIVQKTNFKKVVKDFSFTPSLDYILSSECEDAFVPVEVSRLSRGRLHISGTVRRFYSGQSEPVRYLLILKDVTETKKEEKLKQDFLSLISHKLKTPLTVILGYASLLNKKMDNLSDSQRRAVKALDEQGLHLAGMVDRLISFATVQKDIDRINTVPVIINDTVKRAIDDVSRFTNMAGVQITNDESVKNCPAVLCEENLLVEIFKNLIGNAIKFNDAAKKIVNISAKTSISSARVEISDNGHGILPEERDKIFQPFYQYEESFTGQVDGAGLGLAFVKKAVEACGGAVGVEGTTKGGGSRFYFTLPLA